MTSPSHLFQRGDSLTPQQAQRLAIGEARRGEGFVSLNPLVGCVIVDQEHRLLATGYHALFGGDHAEVDALKKCEGLNLKGATMYVTLEPCSHFGKTPPCADRVVEFPFKKVVIGLKDPNPQVSGRGIEKLKAKGIEVEMDRQFTEDCRELTEVFLWHIQKRRPFVALKVATSLDGQLALKNGESKWLTSEDARRRSRELRGKYDATLIGAQTLLRDDPALDFRGTHYAGEKTNRVVIWDPRERVGSALVQSRLARTLPPENIHVVNDLSIEGLEALYAVGISSLYVEGGAQTHGYLVAHKLFNKIYQFVAPSLVGDGKTWTSSFSISSLQDRCHLNFGAVEKIGSDLLITAYPCS